MSAGGVRRNWRAAQPGVTLPELLLVLALVVVMALLAGPGFSTLAASVATRTDAARLLASLHLARADAVRGGHVTRLCARPAGAVATPRCGDDFDRGWVVLRELSDAGNALLREEAPLRTGMRVRQRDGLRVVSQPLRFRPDGTTRRGATFRFCESSFPGWQLVVSATGRPRLRRDATAC